MIHTIKINLDEIIEHNSTKEERKGIITKIIYDMPDDERKEFFNSLLDDHLQTELEFDKREDVISALEVLIKNLNK